MSLELLKERFGHSGVIKEADNREKLHEKFNVQFNTKSDFKSIKDQHLDELEEKERIIENLETETSELTNEVITLKKDKAVLLNELKESRWMEDKVHLTAKKLYEDKIKTMSYVDSTELIPLLISVSRKKQGNVRFSWDKWLKISENKYLFQINQSIAKKVFKDTNLLIERNVSYINRKRTRGGDAVDKNYVLSFSGDKGAASESYATTDFNPDTYNLNLGCTVSYWVRPDEIGNTMFAFGRKHNNNQRFTFGINRKRQSYFGLGSNTGVKAWANMDTPVEESLLVQDGSYWNLKTDGTWYHIVVTYDDRPDASSGTARKVYVNGVLRQTDTIGWSSTGGGTGGMYFGARNASNSYNNGWACALSEVAIYDTAKDATWVSSVYTSDTKGDHTGANNLVGYWKFNENSGTTITDHSGNGNHGTFGAISGNTTAYPIWGER